MVAVGLDALESVVLNGGRVEDERNNVAADVGADVVDASELGASELAAPEVADADALVDGAEESGDAVLGGALEAGG